MMNLELLEFHYFDDLLTDMKLTPVSPTTGVVHIQWNPSIRTPYGHYEWS